MSSSTGSKSSIVSSPQGRSEGVGSNLLIAHLPREKFAKCVGLTPTFIGSNIAKTHIRDFRRLL